MKESTLGPVQMGQALEDKFISLNKEDTSSHGLENRDMDDREEIERNELSEDEDEQGEVSYAFQFSIFDLAYK